MQEVLPRIVWKFNHHVFTLFRCYEYKSNWIFLFACRYATTSTIKVMRAAQVRLEDVKVCTKSGLPRSPGKAEGEREWVSRSPNAGFEMVLKATTNCCQKPLKDSQKGIERVTRENEKFIYSMLSVLDAETEKGCQKSKVENIQFLSGFRERKLLCSFCGIWNEIEYFQFSFLYNHNYIQCTY